MKVMASILCFSFFSSVAFAEKVFDQPRYDLNGVPHFIVYEDLFEDDWYDSSAMGFCKLNGFSTVYQTSAVLSWDGPYVALDEKGNVLRTFPGEGNAQRFYEFSQIICR